MHLEFPTQENLAFEVDQCVHIPISVETIQLDYENHVYNFVEPLLLPENNFKNE